MEKDVDQDEVHFGHLQRVEFPRQVIAQEETDNFKEHVQDRVEFGDRRVVVAEFEVTV
jgi:hypothetical protein